MRRSHRDVGMVAGETEGRRGEPMGLAVMTYPRREPNQRPLLFGPSRPTRRQAVDMSAELLRRQLTIDTQRKVIAAQTETIRQPRRELADMRCGPHG